MSDQTSASFDKRASGNKHFSDSEIDQDLIKIEEMINQKLHSFLKTLFAMRLQQEDMRWNYMEIQVSKKKHYELDACDKLMRLFSNEDTSYLVIESFKEKREKSRIYPIHDSDGKVCHVLNGYGKKGWEVYDYDARKNRFLLRRKHYYLELECYRVLISDNEISSLLKNVNAPGDC